MRALKKEGDIYTPTECKKFILPVRNIIGINGDYLLQ